MNHLIRVSLVLALTVTAASAQDGDLVEKNRALKAQVDRLRKEQEVLRQEVLRLERENRLLRQRVERLEAGKSPSFLARSIRVAFDKTTLRQALAELTRRTGFQHVLDPGAGDKAERLVTLELEAPLRDVLDALVRAVDLRWELEEKRVVLRSGFKTVTTPSGLRYQDLVRGKGAAPRNGQTVTVHYTGWLKTGKKFDSSRDRGKPIQFRLGVGRVIAGWDEGLSTMKVGGKRRLIIPPGLGYGQRQVGPIPAGSTLVFEVELLGVE